MRKLVAKVIWNKPDHKPVLCNWRGFIGMYFWQCGRSRQRIDNSKPSCIQEASKKVPRVTERCVAV